MLGSRDKTLQIQKRYRYEKKHFIYIIRIKTYVKIDFNN